MGKGASLVATSAALCGVMACSPAATAVERPTLRPGRYEVTSEIELPGLAMAPRTDFECITSEIVRDVRSVLIREGATEGCSLSEPVVDGAKVAFVHICVDDDGVERTTHAELEIDAEAYSGVMRTELRGRTTVMKVRGRRVGRCRE